MSGLCATPVQPAAAEISEIMRIAAHLEIAQQAIGAAAPAAEAHAGLAVAASLAMGKDNMRRVGDQHARLAVAAVAALDQHVLDGVIAGTHQRDAALAACGAALDHDIAQGRVHGIEHDAVARAVLGRRVQGEPEAAGDMEGRMHRVAAGVAHRGLDPGVRRGHRRDARPTDPAGRDAEHLDAFAMRQMERRLADVVEREIGRAQRAHMAEMHAAGIGHGAMAVGALLRRRIAAHREPGKHDRPVAAGGIGVGHEMAVRARLQDEPRALGPRAQDLGVRGDQDRAVDDELAGCEPHDRAAGKALRKIGQEMRIALAELDDAPRRTGLSHTAGRGRPPSDRIRRRSRR